MKHSAASLKHRKVAEDALPPEEAIKGLFSTKQPRFTLRDWMERRKAQGKAVGFGYSPQPMGLERRKASQ